MSTFAGGLFEIRHWSLRKFLEKHPSLRGVSSYEANYINESGYWMTVNEAAITLRQEVLDEKKGAEDGKFDVWVIVFVRYGIRIVMRR